jgi:hypothetical protein
MMDYALKFADILKTDFNSETKKERNFLDIALMPHYENVNSNILQFFFDQNGEHGFKDLFLTSFLELIKSHKQISFLDWTVEREIITKNNKRIDIEIQSVDKDAVIIIENKIYHWLANDLNDYWIHYPNINDDSKIGVVLSLYSMKVNDSRFINITHQQLCKQVLKNLGNYILTAGHKYIIYLKDFIDNINSFYMSESQKNKLEFYFQNVDKINELAKIKEDATNYLLTQLNIVGETLNLPTHAKRSRDRRYFTFPEFKEDILYYAIFVEDIFNSDATFKIILEGHNIKSDVQRKIINQLKGKYHKLQHQEEPAIYIHFLKKTYPFNVKDIANFSKVIIEILEKDFADARHEVTAILLNESDVKKI